MNQQVHDDLKKQIQEKEISELIAKVGQKVIDMLLRTYTPKCGLHNEGPIVGAMVNPDTPQEQELVVYNDGYHCIVFANGKIIGKTKLNLGGNL